jgi:hypothetical protein
MSGVRAGCGPQTPARPPRAVSVRCNAPQRAPKWPDTPWGRLRGEFGERGERRRSRTRSRCASPRASSTSSARAARRSRSLARSGARSPRSTTSRSSPSRGSSCAPATSCSPSSTRTDLLEERVTEALNRGTFEPARSRTRGGRLDRRPDEARARVQGARRRGDPARPVRRPPAGDVGRDLRAPDGPGRLEHEARHRLPGDRPARERRAGRSLARRDELVGARADARRARLLRARSASRGSSRGTDASSA